MDINEQIERFSEFLEQYYKIPVHEAVRRGAHSLSVDFGDLYPLEPELAENLLEDPEEAVRAFEIAVENTALQPKHFHIRFFNLPKAQLLRIRDIRSEHLNKFFCVEGIVRQSSDVRPQVTSAKFECPSCGSTISILQLDTRFKEPTRCSCGRRGKFSLLSKELVDAQRIVLEEVPEGLFGGEQPKRLSVFLKEDLVEPRMEKKTTPGSKVRVSAIIKEVPIQLKSGAQSIRYDIIAEANHIEPIEQTFEEIELSDADVEMIKELASDSKIYDRLINSVAPSVFGHEDIKEALIFQMMGGLKRERGDGTVTRGDMHILLVGDPGAAKSTILTYMAKAAPKARYVAGRGATGTGLTAAVVKDEFLRGWALEAGTLVLANGGFAMIDELDKISHEDTSALHEALAQQQVSISKANIQATLKAQTTVLAAANPKYGRFDPFQPIASQIDLPPALINRFDLIFPVRDIPSRELDSKIATHVLDIHRVKLTAEPEIPIPILKKYVSYVRQNVFPHLSDVAAKEIRDFYVDLRNSGDPGDEGIRPIPISARQLEALIRLSEASARVRLSQNITRVDAQRAIRILKYCLMQVGIDPETGKIDIDRISTGVSASLRTRIGTIREIINSLLSKSEGHAVPLEDILEASAEKKIDESQVEEVIERLKREGDIFEPVRGKFQKL